MKKEQLQKMLAARTGKDLLQLHGARAENFHAIKSYLSPTGGTEKILYSIWENVLGHHEFGVDDDFFSVGGNSLKAIQLVSRISRLCSVDIGLANVFQHTTIALLALHVQQQEKKLLNNVIKAMPRPAHIPLSFSQERLWVIDQLEGHSEQYHMPAVLTLKGPVNHNAVAYALNAIVNRHEVLRTVIYEHDGHPFQQVLERDTWTLTRVDDPVFNKDDGEALQMFIQEIINMPFDLSVDHMLRAHLIQLQPEEHLLVITMHHIASDGWSLAIIERELLDLYGAFTENRPPQTEPLAIQYADYAMWQRHYLQGREFEKKLSYWTGKLEGVVPLQLPANFTRPAVQSTKGAVKIFTIDKALTGRLHQLSRQQGATLFMTLLAAFKVLMYRYSGQDDICIGSPAANRMQQEVENLVGFFVNTLALRSDLSGNPSFSGLLQQVKETTQTAYAHQEIPFEKIVEKVVKERDISRTPLFQVMFALQNNAPADAAEHIPGGLLLSSGVYDPSTSKFDLTFSLQEDNDELVGKAEYCTALFSEETVTRMVNHYIRLLLVIVAEPDQRIGFLPMLTDKERHQQLDVFNDTAVAYPPDKTIIDLFEDQVKLTPDGIAVIFGEQQLTYRQLDERSNRFGRYLKGQGVKADVLVPVYMERSLEMIVGLLGIMKAGGAYVPVDIRYPAERISYMLQDTGAAIIVSSTSCKAGLAKGENLRVVTLDGDSPDIASEPESRLEERPLPRQLAYIIYTSGSTGKPKGVKIEHHSVYTFIRWCRHEFQHSPFDIVYASTSICFDLSVFELFYPLSTGKRIRILEDGLSIGQYVSKETCILINTVPGVIQHWLRERMDFKNVTVINMAGEPVPAEVQQGLDLENIEVRNLYGPSEDTTYSTVYRLKKETPVYIGKPIHNTCIYIVSRDNQLNPVGVTGELCISGDGLSRGYLNNDALTAEKFTPDPFGKTPGSRLYHTGDMARWLPDGNIVYSGRYDDQVKIRGYRIEPGEITHVLEQSEGVLQAVTVVHTDTAGNKRLVSYIVAKGAFKKEAVMEFLRNRLPEFMIPALLVELKSLPVTANGKIDKKALPDPYAGEPAAGGYGAPRNEIETMLVTIWQELLGSARIGIHDNFFEQGGDSIITMQVVSRIRRLGYKVQPRDLFIHQSIAALAGAIRINHTSAASGGQYMLTGPSGMLPIQQWYLKNDPVAVSHFNQSLVLGLNKLADESILTDCIDQLVSHHDALRFIFQKKAEGWQQEYGTSRASVAVVDKQSTHTASLQDAINDCANQYQRSLDITEGIVMRVVLIKTPAAEMHNRLLIIIHHLVVDGVSWRILLEDLELALTAAGKGEHADLGNKSSSYREWYNALERYSRSKQLALQVKYWEDILQSYQPLPVDKDGGEEVIYKETGTHTAGFGMQQTGKLLLEVPRAYHTQIDDILLCALAMTLCRWTGSSNAFIGVESHGRENLTDELDISRTVGWFTSLYPVMLEVQPGIAAGDLVKSVKEQLRKVPDKGTGYGILKYTSGEKAFQRKDPWDIVFNYLGQFDQVIGRSNWFADTGESSGDDVNGDYMPREKIVVNAMIQQGELIVNWRFSRMHYHEATVAALAQNYFMNLELLIRHCMEQLQAGSVFTPSDYGLGTEVGYKELDRLLKGKENNMEDILSF